MAGARRGGPARGPLRQRHPAHRPPARPGKLQRRGPAAGLVCDPGRSVADALLGSRRDTDLGQAQGEDAEADPGRMAGPQVGTGEGEPLGGAPVVLLAAVPHDLVALHAADLASHLALDETTATFER